MFALVFGVSGICIRSTVSRTLSSLTFRRTRYGAGALSSQSQLKQLRVNVSDFNDMRRNVGTVGHGITVSDLSPRRPHLDLYLGESSTSPIKASPCCSPSHSRHVRWIQQLMAALTSNPVFVNVQKPR